MIPILYAKGTTEYTSNGLGRLSGAVSCLITEERNGGYVLEMDYDPTDALAGYLKPWAIIYAMTSEGHCEPFDIVSVVRTYGETIHVSANHVSYRLAGIPVRTRSGQTKLTASSASAAFSALPGWVPTNISTTGWTFETNVLTPATWEPAEPASMKAMIHGMDGSVLDKFGGELRWTDHKVELLTNRGSDNGVSIRYGKNIVSLEHDLSSENAINGTYAYWEQGEDNFYQPSAVGKLTTSNIPFDFAQVVNVRSEFETQPSYADIIAKAQAMSAGKDADSFTLTIDLATGYTDGISSTEDIDTVKLCDAVRVVFDPYGIDVSTKVVKTVYDVIMDRLDSVEIGTIRNTIADTIAGSGTTTVNYNTSGGGDYEARVSALEESVGDLEETVGGLSLTNIGATKLGSVGTTQSTITLPSTTGAFIIVTTHNSTTNNNGMWIVRGASGVFKIGGGSNITITKNNATLTVKSTSGNSDLYAIKLN